MDRHSRARRGDRPALACRRRPHSGQSGSRSLGRPAGSGSSKLAGNGWIHELAGLPSLTRQIRLVTTTPPLAEDADAEAQLFGIDRRM
uniref:Uncharacterized protein n=1 Tax=Oryza rufipogon TaxID=4529 RepID=A0A0E0N5R1_ORYRU